MVKETNHLTVLDMLDVLETGIGILRGQNQSLTAALSNVPERGETPLASPPGKKRAGARKPKKKTPKRRKSVASAPSDPGEPGEPAMKEERVLGKRQALGKSLLQLRRLPSASQSGSPDSADEKHDLFHQS